MNPPVDCDLAWVHALGSADSTPRFSRAGSATATHWHWPLRQMPFHIFYLVLQGSCRGVLDGSPFYLEPGSFLWLRAGAPNEIEQDAHAPLIRYLHLTLEPLPAEPAWDTPGLLLKNALELQQPFQALVDETKLASASTSHPPFHLPRIRAWATLLFATVFEHRRRQSPTDRILTRQQCLRLQEAVAVEPARRFAPVELGRLLGLSPRYFTLLFRNTFGQPPREWLLRQRIHHAAELLHDSTLTLSEIAFQFGYPDLFLFSRQFKQVMGSSPRTYRQSFRG